MEEFLSFVRDAGLIIFKVFIKAFAQDLFKRRKGRTAPTANRDGSDKHS